LDRVDTARDDRGGVPVGGEEPVAVREHLRRGDLACLLPEGGGVDSQPALPHQRGGLLVVPAGRDHARVPAQEVLPRRQRPGAGCRGPTVGAEQRDRLHRGHHAIYGTRHGYILVKALSGFYKPHRSERVSSESRVVRSRRPEQRGRGACRRDKWPRAWTTSTSASWPSCARTAACPCARWPRSCTSRAPTRTRACNGWSSPA